MFRRRSSVVPQPAFREHLFDEVVPVGDRATCMYNLVTQAGDQLDVQTQISVQRLGVLFDLRQTGKEVP